MTTVSVGDCWVLCALAVSGGCSPCSSPWLVGYAYEAHVSKAVTSSEFVLKHIFTARRRHAVVHAVSRSRISDRLPSTVS